MAWTFCTSGAAVVRAGAGASSAITGSGSHLANWSDEAESIICDIARIDLVTNFGTLKANGKQILQNLCSAMIAQKIVSYDTSGYNGGVREADTILDVLENEIERGVELIEEKKVTQYLGIDTSG